MSQRPDEEWPDHLWPDDAGSPGQPGNPAGGDAPGGRWAGPVAAEGGPGGRPPRRARPAALAAIALAAALAGGAIALVVHDLYSSPSAGAAAPGSQPSLLAPGQSGGNGQPGANGGFAGGGPGGTASIFVIGKVTAVTSTSITISGPGHDMTAAVTSSTRVTGTVSGISGIKAGDEVSAQLTASGGKVTAVAIQDPAQPPSGGSLP